MFYCDNVKATTVVFLMTIVLCSADIHEVNTQFVKNEDISTSSETTQHILNLILFIGVREIDR